MSTMTRAKFYHSPPGKVVIMYFADAWLCSGLWPNLSLAREGESAKKKDRRFIEIGWTPCTIEYVRTYITDTAADNHYAARFYGTRNREISHTQHSSLSVPLDCWLTIPSYQIPRLRCDALSNRRLLSLSDMRFCLTSSKFVCTSQAC